MFDKIVNQPTIETDRFCLRPMRRADAGLIGLYASEKRLARMARSIPHPFPPGAAENFIALGSAPERDRDIWVMDGAAHDHAEVMGLISMTPIERNQDEVRFWVAPAFWNDGIASEALNALIAANPHGSQTLFAEVFQDNPGSAKVVTNAGFDYLGDAEAFSVARNANVPTWTYSRKMDR